MTIKLLRCGICKHWHSVHRDPQGIARNVHCSVCGSHRVYFSHWRATYFNTDGKQVVRAAHAGLTGIITR